MCFSFYSLFFSVYLFCLLSIVNNVTSVVLVVFYHELDLDSDAKVKGSFVFYQLLFNVDVCCGVSGVD